MAAKAQASKTTKVETKKSPKLQVKVLFDSTDKGKRIKGAHAIGCEN